MHKRVLHAVVTAVVAAGLTVPATGTAGATEPPRAGRPAGTRELPPSGRLQVKFKAGVGAAARADALARVAARGHAVGVQRRIAALNATVLDVGDQRGVLRLLRGDHRVEYVEPESRYRAFAETPSAELVEIGAAAVHAQATPNVGAGMEIAVIDSPVSSTVPDLDGAGKVVNAGDFTQDWPDMPGSPWTDIACDSDACPHGTGVATVAAAEADGTAMVGVAPGAAIRSYSVFRHWVFDDGVNEWHELGADSGAIADALVAVGQYGAANPSLVAVNMSLGSPFDNRLIRDAIAYVKAQAPQVTIVVASGNDGKERANFPAGDPGVLSVGATGNIPDSGECTDTPAATWTVAGFSNRGDVDVVAPGRCVDAWYPTQNDMTGKTNPGTLAVRKVDGTSFAAPMVAGVAAMLGAAGVTGDAARAAIIASAQGTPSVNVGAGKANAPAALDVADGPGPYTAMTVERGNQVASNVGRRTVEVIRVAPGATATTTLPVPTVSSSAYGAFTAKTKTEAVGLARGTYGFAVPDVNRAGAWFSIAANGGGGGADSITLPMKMLDAYNSFEGLPAASGETGSAALKYGSRSAYIRSVKVPSTGGYFEYDYTFGEAVVDPNMPRPASLFLWEPASAGGTADAAMEPVYQSYADPDARSDSDYWTAGGAESDYCEYDGTGDPDDPANWRVCRTGRYLVGFLADWPDASSSSTSRYSLRLRYGFGPTLTTNVPSLASASGPTTLPFWVTWGGTRAVKWDVSWATKTKSGSTWTLGAWKPWKVKTTAKTGAFGSGNTPTAVKAGTTYWFRIQGWDSLGNPTLPVVKSTAVPVDDRSLVYSTGSLAWTKVGGLSDRWLTTATKTGAAGAKAVYSAETSSFMVIGDRCSTCGQLRVYVDGVHKKTVDTYRSTTAVRQVLWSSGSLGAVKAHRISIVVVGTRGRPKVVLDGIATLR